MDADLKAKEHLIAYHTDDGELDVVINRMLEKQARLHRRLMLYVAGTTLALIFSLLALAANIAPRLLNETRRNPQDLVPSSR